MSSNIKPPSPTMPPSLMSLSSLKDSPDLTDDVQNLYLKPISPLRKDPVTTILETAYPRNIKLNNHLMGLSEESPDPTHSGPSTFSPINPLTKAPEANSLSITSEKLRPNINKTTGIVEFIESTKGQSVCIQIIKNPKPYAIVILSSPVNGSDEGKVPMHKAIVHFDNTCSENCYYCGYYGINLHILTHENSSGKTFESTDFQPKNLGKRLSGKYGTLQDIIKAGYRNQHGVGIVLGGDEDDFDNFATHERIWPNENNTDKPEPKKGCIIL